NAFSVATWNGTPLTTTATSRTTLQATLPATAITGTSAQVAVTNPAPGGGTSGSVTVPIDPPAVLSVSATAVAPSTSVTMTPPGGGTSSTLALPIVAPIALTVSATSAAPGANVTVTLANGYAGIFDWMALALTTAPTTSYVAYTYVGGGVTNRTWTVAMPSTP